LIDLVDGFTGYVDQERNQILDLGWGAVFGLILPLGLLAQLRFPERRIAGVQQTSVVALGLALAGAAGESWWYLVLAAGVAGVSAVLLTLHPARQTLRVWAKPDPTMLALAAIAAVQHSSTRGAWPRRSGVICRRRMPCRTALPLDSDDGASATLLLLVLLAASAHWAGESRRLRVVRAGAWAISRLPALAAVGSEGQVGRGQSSLGLS
jgi:hypothetical protein